MSTDNENRKGDKKKRGKRVCLQSAGAETAHSGGSSYPQRRVPESSGKARRKDRERERAKAKQGCCHQSALSFSLYHPFARALKLRRKRTLSASPWQQLARHSTVYRESRRSSERERETNVPSPPPSLSLSCFQAEVLAASLKQRAHLQQLCDAPRGAVVRSGDVLRHGLKLSRVLRHSLCFLGALAAAYSASAGTLRAFAADGRTIRIALFDERRGNGRERRRDSLVCLILFFVVGSLPLLLLSLSRSLSLPALWLRSSGSSLLLSKESVPPSLLAGPLSRQRG